MKQRFTSTNKLNQSLRGTFTAFALIIVASLQANDAAMPHIEGTEVNGDEAISVVSQTDARMEFYAEGVERLLRPKAKVKFKNRFSENVSKDRTSRSRTTTAKLEWETRDDVFALYFESRYKINESERLSTQMSAKLGLKYSPRESWAVNMSLHSTDKRNFERPKLNTSIALFF